MSRLLRRRAAAVIVIAVAFAACSPDTREEGVALVGAGSAYEVADDGRLLTIHAIVGMSDCYANHDLRVHETADAVTVELVGRRRTGPDFCPAGGVIYDTSYTLTEPLGDRPVVDVTSGELVELRDW